MFKFIWYIGVLVLFAIDVTGWFRGKVWTVSDQVASVFFYFAVGFVVAGDLSNLADSCRECDE